MDPAMATAQNRGAFTISIDGARETRSFATQLPNLVGDEPGLTAKSLIEAKPGGGSSMSTGVDARFNRPPAVRAQLYRARPRIQSRICSASGQP
jgi:hypothetical protein